MDELQRARGRAVKHRSDECDGCCERLLDLMLEHPHGRIILSCQVCRRRYTLAAEVVTTSDATGVSAPQEGPEEQLPPEPADLRLRALLRQRRCAT